MRWRQTDADLYHQWEEAEGRAEKWEKTAKEERKQTIAISDMRAEFRREMAQMRGEFEGRIESMTQENIELMEGNKKPREGNERLKSQPNNNSNSSKPPSSDQKPSKQANEYNGREKQRKKAWRTNRDELALLNRMEKYGEKHPLFLHRFDALLNNNMSKRDLRKCKNPQKMSGSFGVVDGRNMSCRILSFVESCKRRTLNVFQTLYSAFSSPVLVNGGIVTMLLYARKCSFERRGRKPEGFSDPAFSLTAAF